jgi:MFS family permease
MTRDTVIGKLLPWQMWGLGAVLYCYAFFQRVAPGVMVSDLMRDFGVNAAILGNLSAFYFYAYACIQVPVGITVDRFGPRLTLAVSAALCGFGSLLLGTAETLVPAFAGRLLLGAGSGFFWVGALTLATIWFPPRRFALVTGLTMTLGMVGAFAGQAPLATAVALVGWRATMLGAAVFAAVMAGLVWLIVRDAPDGSPAPTKAAQGSLLHGLVSAMATPQTWFTGFYLMFLAAPLLAFGGLWGVPFIMEAYGLDRPAAALATSMMTLGAAVGAPSAGWISDFIQRRRLPMIIGGVLNLLSVAAMIYLPGLPMPVVHGLLFLAGFSFGFMVLTFATSREHNLPEAKAATLGLVNMIGMSSGALFQPLIGWLLDLGWDGRIEAGARVYSLDAYHMAFVSLIVSCTGAIVCAALVRETHCRQVRQEMQAPTPVPSDA